MFTSFFYKLVVSIGSVQQAGMTSRRPTPLVKYAAYTVPRATRTPPSGLQPSSHGAFLLVWCSSL